MTDYTGYTFLGLYPPGYSVTVVGFEPTSSRLKAWGLGPLAYTANVRVPPVDQSVTHNRPSPERELNPRLHLERVESIPLDHQVRRESEHHWPECSPVSLVGSSHRVGTPFRLRPLSAGRKLIRPRCVRAHTYCKFLSHQELVDHQGVEPCIPPYQSGSFTGWIVIGKRAGDCTQIGDV